MHATFHSGIGAVIGLAGPWGIPVAFASHYAADLIREGKLSGNRWVGLAMDAAMVLALLGALASRPWMVAGALAAIAPDVLDKGLRALGEPQVLSCHQSGWARWPAGNALGMRVTWAVTLSALAAAVVAGALM